MSLILPSHHLSGPPPLELLHNYSEDTITEENLLNEGEGKIDKINNVLPWI